MNNSGKLCPNCEDSLMQEYEDDKHKVLYCPFCNYSEQIKSKIKYPNYIR